ncbi:MAG: HU family DNA-binding protein [Microgenomates group bacterium]
MVNKKKSEKEFLDTDSFVTVLAQKAGFTKGDIKVVINTFKDILEECVKNDIDVDLKGLFHMSVIDIEYTKPPGIVAFKGGTDFNRNAKRVKFVTPLNLRDIAKASSEKQNNESSNREVV